jgi:two-component system sensor histidine kinase ComP
MLVNCSSVIRKAALVNMIVGIMLSGWNLSHVIRLPKERSGKNEAAIVLLGMVIGFIPSIFIIANTRNI